MAIKSQSIKEKSIRGLVETANQLRKAGKLPAMHELISSAKTRGLSLGWPEISALSILQGRGAPAVVPPFITRFLAGYLSDREFRSVLDPWAGCGSLLLPVLHATKIKDATGTF